MKFDIYVENPKKKTCNLIIKLSKFTFNKKNIEV